ncbi:GTP-binding protein HflX [Perkinsela sp. CCAP 1560/4]|nr:GTP-binding protein HflX [Perkinsela sp. CCAP 1560/4]|eukprot:KNH03625.1 GTP-binding protein HflX [Perkinsela sp. CCAP 1560/4]
MFRQTTVSHMPFQNPYAGFRFLWAHFFAPNYFRHHLALGQTRKIERHLRLQSALKANKVDIRKLLALPVCDSAHPYHMEYPWERMYTGHSDPRGLTRYGQWYRAKIDAVYDMMQNHKFGAYLEDFVNARGWWNRAARTRAPKDQVIHMDRRILRFRWAKDRYIYDHPDKWVHPKENVPFFTPYVVMVADEWEEKWGFFAGAETEY